MTFLTGRTNRTTYGVYLAVYLMMFSLSIVYKIKIYGEVLLAFICVPRLHDLGRTGWWALVAIAIDLGVVVAATLNPVLKGVNLVIGVTMLFVPAIVLLLIPGRTGANRFGDEPPRGIGRPTVPGKS